MKVKLFARNGTEKGNVSLPKVFSTSIRKDIIKRATDAQAANSRQAYGAKKDAGMRASAELSRRRHDYRGSYGHGISRVPRKIMSRRGTRMNWVAAVAPGTVGGRRAHPPKVEKDYTQKINTKEKRLAIRSALAATMDKTLVADRGHQVPATFPVVVDASFESIKKTKEMISSLESLGFSSELVRSSQKKVRAGKGKARGRKYRRKTGLLVVVSDTSALQKSISNVPGFEVVSVSQLNATLLAPGGQPGRLTLFTESALEEMESKKLYTDSPVVSAAPKKSADVKETKKTTSAKSVSKKTTKTAATKVAKKAAAKKE